VTASGMLGSGAVTGVHAATSDDRQDPWLRDGRYAASARAVVGLSKTMTGGGAGRRVVRPNSSSQLVTLTRDRRCHIAPCKPLRTASETGRRAR
jgi:hypothetical protein